MIGAGKYSVTFRIFFNEHIGYFGALSIFTPYLFLCVNGWLY
jgi:hypothetical protein